MRALCDGGMVKDEPCLQGEQQKGSDQQTTLIRFCLVPRANLHTLDDKFSDANSFSSEFTLIRTWENLA